MKPWFRGFKGRSTRMTRSMDDGRCMEGTLVPDSKSLNFHRDVGPRITRNTWTHSLEKKMISSYTNNSTTEDVDFEILATLGRTLVKDLKMKKTFHTSNMHLFHPTRGIHKYRSPEEILKDFVELRSEHYKKRKAHLIRVF